MGRNPRFFDAAEIYHLTMHAVDGLAALRDPVDCQDFVLRLGRTTRLAAWRIHAACLMTTHYHVVVQPATGEVSGAMRNLNGGFARSFNARRKRRGAVWESRFAVEVVAEQAHLIDAIRYVAHNPVKAGLVARPQDWPWSTYGQIVGSQRRWPFFDPLLPIEVFGGLRQLRAYVEGV
jgi:putative transposase